jgi:hypothetical protein
LRRDRHSAGDEQGTIGAFERIAERLDRQSVLRAILGEFREVVDEGRVDHAVGCGRAAAQPVQILDGAAVHLGARCRKRCGSLVRPGEPEHGVAGADQFLDDGRADEAGRAGDEDMHGNSPVGTGLPYRSALYRGKVVTLYRYNG